MPWFMISEEVDTSPISGTTRRTVVRGKSLEHALAGVRELGVKVEPEQLHEATQEEALKWANYADNPEAAPREACNTPGCSCSAHPEPLLDDALTPLQIAAIAAETQYAPHQVQAVHDTIRSVRLPMSYAKLVGHMMLSTTEGTDPVQDAISVAAIERLFGRGGFIRKTVTIEAPPAH